ncbi:hypothetical protein [Sphaerisporangium dianthi]|uniref:Uncharacterized protein n=1 Tax=Sphaerisporangium dianthi TaxID=1436120 RepID=A0ABV9CLB5_9ACTN
MSSRAPIHSPPTVSSNPLNTAGLGGGRSAAASVQSVAIGPTRGTAAPSAATAGVTAIAGHGSPLTSAPSQENTATTATTVTGSGCERPVILASRRHPA